MRPFYVYALCDPRKPGEFSYGNLRFGHKPFYVGKGKGRRAWRHQFYLQKNDNPYKDRIIRKLLSIGNHPEVVILKSGIEESEAFALEREAIGLIGRSNFSTGPLANLSEGGEGNAGYAWTNEQRKAISGGIRSGPNNPFFGKEHSEQTKALMRAVHADVTGPRNSFYGKHHSEKTKALLSSKNRGRKIGSFSEGHRTRISEALKGIPRRLSPLALLTANQKRAENLRLYGHPHKRLYLVNLPDGSVLEVRNLKQWCRESSINYHMLLYTAQGRYYDWHGYSCKVKLPGNGNAIPA